MLHFSRNISVTKLQRILFVKYNQSGVVCLIISKKKKHLKRSDQTFCFFVTWAMIDVLQCGLKFIVLGSLLEEQQCFGSSSWNTKKSKCQRESPKPRGNSNNSFSCCKKKKKKREKPIYCPLLPLQTRLNASVRTSVVMRIKKGHHRCLRVSIPPASLLTYPYVINLQYLDMIKNCLTESLFVPATNFLLIRGSLFCDCKIHFCFD